jgi:energy-coupling factor transporter ATP-binding protein EcfA2
MIGHVLTIEGLTANVGSREILRGIDLEIQSGEVHVVMGPNGSGKSTLSHVIAGRPGYEVTGGKVTLDGLDLLALPAWKRARAGLFLAMQYPIEVPGAPPSSPTGARPRWCPTCWRPRPTVSGSTGAFSTGRSMSTCRVVSASATRRCR